MKKLLFMVLIIAPCFFYGQNIKIIDNLNLKPIENVLIVNESQTKSAITNTKGETTLNTFSKDEMLLFQHPSYKRIKLKKSDAIKNGNVLKLTETNIKINEVLISANKWEQNKNEVPNKITTIKSSEIDFHNPQTSADLLKISNQVYVQKSQLGGGSPMLRGFSANSILLVYDGVRMNNVIYRSGNLQNVISLDANIIESSEVIFGPGSVIYGSDALGGVMDFHSIKPKFSTDTAPYIKTNELFRFSSASLEKTIHFDLNYGKKNFASFTSVSYSFFDDLRMGSVGNDDYVRPEFVASINQSDTILLNTGENIQKHSGYNQLNITQKFRFSINKYTELNYGIHYSKTSNVPRYDRLIQYKDDDLKYARWDYGPMYWMMHQLLLEYKKPNFIFDQAKINFAYQDYEESRIDRKYKSDIKRTRTETVDILSLNADFDKQISNKSRIFYGIESTYNYAASEAEQLNITTNEITDIVSRYPNGGTDYYSLAGYISYRAHLGEKITFNTGARYSMHWLQSSFADTSLFHFPYTEIELSPKALNGSLGVTYKMNKSHLIRINFSSGFRAPNLDDVAKIFDSEPGFVIVPNSNLQPEYSNNIDLGYTLNINNIFKFELTGFYSYITDIMTRDNFTFNGNDSIIYDGEMSKVQAIVNKDNAWIAGISTGFYAELSEHFSLSSDLTLMKGEDNEGNPIRHVSPLFSISHLTYTRNKFKADFYIEYNGEISPDQLALSEISKTYMYKLNDIGEPYSPSWYTFNAKIAYQWNENFQLNLGMENILDHRYRPYSSGIIASGRNLIFAIRANI